MRLKIEIENLSISIFKRLEKRLGVWSNKENKQNDEQNISTVAHLSEDLISIGYTFP